MDVKIWKNIQSDADISFFLSTIDYVSASGKQLFISNVVMLHNIKFCFH